MSFISFASKPLRTKEQIAKEVHQVSLARGLDKFATVLVCMAIAVEVGAKGEWWCPANRRVSGSFSFPHDSESDDNRSMGYLQQQPGPNGEPWWGTTEEMMTLSKAANTFLERLDDNYGSSRNSPALAGEFVANVQQCASQYRYRYAQEWSAVWDVVNKALGDTVEIGKNPTKPPNIVDKPSAILNRPDFNEYSKWCPNFQGRGKTKVDLFLLHTQEGDGNADQLADFLISTKNRPASQGGPVSYHYTISVDLKDNGVTVVDCVDTDFASWSAGNSNNRSINLCFAGSRVSFSRDEWLKRSRAIDVAAFIAVQDCKKYGIPIKVLAPPYSALGGISDHRYCGAFLKDGNSHTDVDGPNGPYGPPFPRFPWDYFTERVKVWAGIKDSSDPSSIPPIPPAAKPVNPEFEILAQTRGRWECLGWQTQVEALAEIRDLYLGTKDRKKTGFRW